MITDSVFQFLFLNIDWARYVIAVITTFAFGTLWYSVFFPKKWMRIFKVDIQGKPSRSNVMLTMSIQLVASALLGIGLFMLAAASFWLAVLVLAGFCGWRKASLKSQFANWKDFFTAAGIEVLHLFISGMIFIIFAAE